jgi:hypothetical protein
MMVRIFTGSRHKNCQNGHLCSHNTKTNCTGCCRYNCKCMLLLGQIRGQNAKKQSVKDEQSTQCVLIIAPGVYLALTNLQQVHIDPWTEPSALQRQPEPYRYTWAKYMPRTDPGRCTMHMIGPTKYVNITIFMFVEPTQSNWKHALDCLCRPFTTSAVNKRGSQKVVPRLG